MQDNAINRMLTEKFRVQCKDGLSASIKINILKSMQKRGRVLFDPARGWHFPRSKKIIHEYMNEEIILMKRYND